MKSRQKELLRVIQDEKHVTFSRLKEIFPGVSEITIRRDLEQLNEDHLIVRVYGGAKSVDSVVGFTEELYANRLIRNVDKKNMIADKALQFVEKNSTVFLDSGTTATLLSKKMPDDYYKVFTSGLTCALELAHLSKTVVHMIGGRLYKNSLSVNGTQSVKMIENICFDTAFIGATGYTIGKGFAVNEEEDYELKKQIIKRSARVVVLMDTAKVNQRGTYIFAKEEDINILITEQGKEVPFLESLSQKGIEVL